MDTDTEANTYIETTQDSKKQNGVNMKITISPIIQSFLFSCSSNFQHSNPLLVQINAILESSIPHIDSYLFLQCHKSHSSPPPLATLLESSTLIFPRTMGQSKKRPPQTAEFIQKTKELRIAQQNREYLEAVSDIVQNTTSNSKAPLVVHDSPFTFETKTKDPHLKDLYSFYGGESPLSTIIIASVSTAIICGTLMSLYLARTDNLEINPDAILSSRYSPKILLSALIGGISMLIIEVILYVIRSSKTSSAKDDKTQLNDRFTITSHIGSPSNSSPKITPVLIGDINLHVKQS